MCILYPAQVERRMRTGTVGIGLLDLGKSTPARLVHMDTDWSTVRYPLIERSSRETLVKRISRAERGRYCCKGQCII